MIWADSDVNCVGRDVGLYRVCGNWKRIEIGVSLAAWGDRLREGPREAERNRRKPELEV